LLLLFLISLLLLGRITALAGWW